MNIDDSNKIVSNDGIISPATIKTNNQRNSLTDLQMARKSKQQRRSCQGPHANKQNEQQSPLIFSSSSTTTTTTTQHHPNYHSSNYQLKNTKKSQMMETKNNGYNDDDDDDEHNDDEPNFDYDENEFDEVFDGANEMQPPRYSMLQQQPLRNANRGICHF
jgi:hypothetical protein